ncbi:MAG: aminopeptidase [candidate division WOR-3 bacterium]|uniref:Aminopeptidase n=2 Tax=candidate division WOR-3 bacterium TaxID=2052148 RepID=A0A7C1SD12_UNCW3|nr:aminopeptidase [candidate division WOR-3 bacterium]
MFDPRVEKLAQVLIHYSLQLKKDEWLVMIGPANADELYKAALVEALKAGAYVTMRVGIADAAYLFYRYASEKQLSFVSPTEKLEVEKADALLYVWSGWNTKEFTSIDPKRLAVAQRARKPLFETRLRREAAGKLRWVGTLYPTPSSAQDAEMALIEYQEFVYGAGKLDRRDPIREWQEVSRRQARLIRKLNRFKTIRIVGEDTDITFGVRGRKWINCDGRVNFPDGEVFTGPEEDKTEGKIRFHFPAVYMGKEVVGVQLVFEKGRVVEAKAEKGEDLLKAMLATDEGAGRVGELAFGTNYSIQRFTKNTLFDEKIGGTIHMALGASLPESGGKNKSAIHWDMICDTRRQGYAVYGDGRLIMKEGRLVI